MNAPCAGQSDLFDSTDYYDHRRARQLCATCPLIDACHARLQQTRSKQYSTNYGPRGTWAGQLLGRGLATPARIAAEEAMFTDAEARACHTEWWRAKRDGTRDQLTDRVALGERVYQRRSKRRNGRVAA